MNIFSAIVVYVLIWWMAFFCTLPFKIKNIENATDGSMPGAPVNPGLKWKAAIASGIALVGTVIVYFIVTSNLISYHEIAQRMAM